MNVRATANSRFYGVNARDRRGAMIVLIALLMVVFFAAVAFSVDVAYMQLTQTRLRTATDAAARAGGEALARLQDTTAARQAAKSLAAANRVAGEPLILDDSDIVFGSSVRAAGGAWVFTAGREPINALRVHGRRTADSPSGSVRLFFGRILGVESFEPTQTASVVRFDRDICLVVDRSSSMKLRVDEAAGGMSPGDPRFCAVPHPSDSRWAALCVAANAFLGELDGTPQTETVGLVSYASNNTYCNDTNNVCDTNQSLTEDSGLVRDAMVAISGTSFNGGTNMSAGIDRGVVVLTDLATARPYARKSIVVFTDGHVTEGRSPVFAAEDAAAEGIMVHTVTFGDGADQVTMQAAASAGGGKHYHAPDVAALEAIFREIALTMLVVLTE